MKIRLDVPYSYFDKTLKELKGNILQKVQNEFSNFQFTIIADPFYDIAFYLENSYEKTSFRYHVTYWFKEYFGEQGIPVVFYHRDFEPKSSYEKAGYKLPLFDIHRMIFDYFIELDLRIMCEVERYHHRSLDYRTYQRSVSIYEPKIHYNPVKKTLLSEVTPRNQHVRDLYDIFSIYIPLERKRLGETIWMHHEIQDRFLQNPKFSSLLRNLTTQMVLNAFEISKGTDGACRLHIPTGQFIPFTDTPLNAELTHAVFDFAFEIVKKNDSHSLIWEFAKCEEDYTGYINTKLIGYELMLYTVLRKRGFNITLEDWGRSKCYVATKNI